MSLIVWFLAIFAVGLIGLHFGYDIGVTETERRWSEAVQRAGHR